MEITYLGKTGFKVKGKSVSLALNPQVEKLGRVIPDIIISENIKEALPDSFIVRGPGEYEVKGVNIHGHTITPRTEENSRTVVYQITLDNVTLLYGEHLIDNLPESKLKDLDDIDILIIPAISANGEKAKHIGEIISQIEPSIVLPMGQNGNEEILKELAKEFGKEITQTEKLTTTKDKLPTETEVVVLRDRS